MSKVLINKRCLFFLVIMAAMTLNSCTNSGDTAQRDKSPWQRVGFLNTPRMAAASITVGDTLYVLGGLNERYSSECEWTRVSDSGRLGKWQKTHSLNTPRGYAAAVSYNRHVYVIGGAYGEHGSKLLNTVERARINPDGSIGRWHVEEQRMFSARRGTTAVISGGYIYAIGGYNGEFLDTVERARINKDGTLGEWSLVSIMRQRRYIHSTVALGRDIYVIGGHKRSSGGALSGVEFASVNNDASLKEWRDGGGLEIARYGASAFAYGDYLYVVGGFDQRPLDTIERARVDDDGSPGKWNVISYMTTARNSPSALVHDNHVYIIGGSDDKGKYLASIEAVTLDKLGDFKSWDD